LLLTELQTHSLLQQVSHTHILGGGKPYINPHVLPEELELLGFAITEAAYPAMV
jgi:hypothetical protein